MGLTITKKRREVIKYSSEKYYIDCNYYLSSPHVACWLDLGDQIQTHVHHRYWWRILIPSDSFFLLSSTNIQKQSKEGLQMEVTQPFDSGPLLEF